MKRPKNAKLLQGLTCMLVLCLLASCAFASGRTIEIVQDDLGQAWTLESYPEMMLSSKSASGILLGDDAPDFIGITPAEGFLPYAMDERSSDWINFETMAQWSYFLYGNTTVEEQVEKSNSTAEVIESETAGVTIIVDAADHSASALRTVEQYADGSLLSIAFYDLSEEMDHAALLETIEKEAARVHSSLEIRSLDQFWSKDAYESIQLKNARHPAVIEMDVTGLVLCGAGDAFANLIKEYLYQEEATEEDEDPYEELYTMPVYVNVRSQAGLDEADAETRAAASGFEYYVQLNDDLILITVPLQMCLST